MIENMVIALEAIEVSLAITIAVFLLLINRRRNNSMLFLALFLFAIGLSSVNSFFESMGIIEMYPDLRLLPLEFLWLIPALLYVYVQKIANLQNQKINYAILIPGAIEFFIGSIIFFLPLQTKDIIEESFLYVLSIFCSFLFTLVILILILKKVRKHTKELKEQYSSLEYKELSWVYHTVIIILLSNTILITIAFFSTNIFNEIIIYLSSLFLVYWVSIKGLLHQKTIDFLDVSNKKDKVIIEKPLSSNSDGLKSIDLMERINEVLLKEAYYLDPNLNIGQLAEFVGEHPKLVSSTINLVKSENFNNYINRFRIDKAKEMLLSDKCLQLNVQGIGVEVGFKSNSTFYNAFKKYEGCTPLYYVKSQNKE